MSYGLSKRIEKLLRNQGFTIIEVLIALVVIAVGLITVAGIQAWFAKYTSDKFIGMCLTQALESARITCQNGVSPPTTFYCNGLLINLAPVDCSFPSPGTCKEVNLRASYELRNALMVIKVCNFR